MARRSGGERCGRQRTPFSLDRNPGGAPPKVAECAVRRALNYKAAPREHPKTAAAKKWLPWLQAYSGARVGELAQLRSKDVQRNGRHRELTITPEAGTVKNKETREIPLHPHLIEMGFPAFAGENTGYLFLNAASIKEVPGRLRAVKNRVREFARDVIPDTRVAPNHGWRHRFITESRKQGVDQEKRRTITGHAGEGVDEKTYGDRAGLYKEICKLPPYKV
jgi:integrase